MTKEQMQEAMDQIAAENTTLKQKVSELETKLQQAGAELDNAGETIDCLKKQITEPKTTPSPAPDDYTRQLELYRTQAESGAEKIKVLLAALQAGCADHCPHHAAPDACRNCSIGRQITAAGFTIQPPAAESK